MESAPVSSCANCGVQASKRCTGCVDAPEYQPGDSLEVFYCGSDCQQLHWQSHKAQCNIRRKRKKLLRAVMLMKATFLAFRECVFSFSLMAIEPRDGVLVLLHDPDPKLFQPWLSPFPEGVTTNDRHKEAVMAADQCKAAPSLLGRLARHLLKGTTSDIQVFTVEVEQLMPWKIEFHNSDIPPILCDGLAHTILVAQIKDESWVIDVTGCQYGFPEVISPCVKYFRDRVLQVLDIPHFYSEIETSDIDRQQQDDESETFHRKHETAARLHFKALIMERFIDGPPDFTRRFLDSAQEDFQIELDRFVADVKEHMMEFVQRMHGKTDPDD
ncbi:hypothetical protein F4776DRAFT_670427 [Hypoxylon sp. NC0597]|nr:hypothetical protein F4776DRAFT_670427 [Hypoxylon sp. NC0597]